MNEKTAAMILGWLAMDNGDVEACAKWMRDSLRLAGIRQCREFIKEAQATVQA